MKHVTIYCDAEFLIGILRASMDRKMKRKNFLSLFKLSRCIKTDVLDHLNLKESEVEIEVIYITPYKIGKKTLSVIKKLELISIVSKSFEIVIERDLERTLRVSDQIFFLYKKRFFDKVRTKDVSGKMNLFYLDEDDQHSKDSNGDRDYIPFGSVKDLSYSPKVKK